MATRPDDDDEPLELTDELEPGDESEEQQPGDENPDDEGDEQPVVSFDGEEPEPEPENSTVRQMRQALREKDRRIKELEQSSAPKPIEVGEEPTLEGCDFDGEKYKEEILAWQQRKSAADQQNATHEEQAKAARESWDQAGQRYKAKVAEYGFSDISDDEALVEAALGINSPVILKAANDPALMIRALGRNPAKLAELAKLKDPFEIAAAVARMEGAVKVTNRKAPTPDKPLRGSASMPGGGDKELEKLEKKAAQTGDRTELIAYKKKRDEAAKSK